MGDRTPTGGHAQRRDVCGWITVRGALCGRQDPYGRPLSEERRVGPGNAYRAISKVQEASCEKSQPTSLQGASCPCLRMTWICH